jgi:hypothetical protein
MATIKKAQGGGLIKKAIKAATSTTPKKVVIPPGLQRSLKKSQSGPTKITPYSSEAERIAAGGPTNLQKNKTLNKFDPNYKDFTKSKKQPKVDKYGFDTRPDRNGGMHKAQFGKMIKKGVKAIGNEASAIKSGIKKGVEGYKKDKFFSKLRDPNSPIPKMPKEKAPKPGTYMKYKNGGSLSGLNASNKRVGPIDPKGAFTKVQKKTLAGAKGKASLTKDKQLGATKMSKK